MKRVWLIALSAALLFALIAWRSPVPSRAPVYESTAARPPAAPAARRPSLPDAVTPSPAPAVHSPAPPGDEADPLHHPITPEHVRLYRDVDLLDDAWQALEARDFTRARAALIRHRSEYPSAFDDLNEGLSLLADCMEQPSAAARARAQHFYDEHTYSMARRRIRRECLEATH